MYLIFRYTNLATGAQLLIYANLAYLSLSQNAGHKYCWFENSACLNYSKFTSSMVCSPSFPPIVQIAENCLCYLSKRIYHLLWLGKDVQEKICDYVVCLPASMYNIYTVRRVREKTSGCGRSKRQSCPPLLHSVVTGASQKSI